MKKTHPPGYTPGMKTAISVPDEIFQEGERLARRMKKSRSQLYSEAMAEYVARHDPEAVTAKMDEVCEALGHREDSWLDEAVRQVLERVEW